MKVFWETQGRVQRRDRRFHVSAWRRGNKMHSGPHTYHRTSAVAFLVAWWLAFMGFAVEVRDRQNRGHRG